MRAAFLSSCFVAAALFGAQPSGAADVYSEISLAQLEAVLGKSFSVKRETTDTGTFLLVEGSENIIGADVRNCGKNNKCEGVEFWAAVSRKYTHAQANEFNRSYGYAKILVMRDGKSSVWTQHLTLGGITADNIRYAAAMTMLREDDAEKQTIAEAPVNPGNVSQLSATQPDLTALLHQEAYDGTRSADHAAKASELAALRNERPQ